MVAKLLSLPDKLYHLLDQEKITVKEKYLVMDLERMETFEFGLTLNEKIYLISIRF